MFFNLDFYGFIIKMSVTDRTGGFSHAKVTKKNPLLLRLHVPKEGAFLFGFGSAATAATDTSVGGWVCDGGTCFFQF